jgi:hypothetical protein
LPRTKEHRHKGQTLQREPSKNIKTSIVLFNRKPHWQPLSTACNQYTKTGGLCKGNFIIVPSCRHAAQDAVVAIPKNPKYRLDGCAQSRYNIAMQEHNDILHDNTARCA